MKRWKFVIPYATLVLCLITIISYLIISEGQAYIYPINKMDLFGVTGNNLLGAFTYSFMHIGLKHMLGNLLVLLVLGMVLEQRLGSKHTFGLYIVSGTIAGMIYAIIYPNVWVIGASAAISGLIIAAYIVDIKKTTIMLIAVIIFVPYIAFPIIDYALNLFQKTRIEQAAIYSQELEKLNESLEELEEEIERGNESALSVYQNISLKIYTIQKRVKQIENESAVLIKGRKTEAITPTSLLIHILGIFIACTYLYLFKPNAYSWLRKDVNEFIKAIRRD